MQGAPGTAHAHACAGAAANADACAARCAVFAKVRIRGRLGMWRAPVTLPCAPPARGLAGSLQGTSAAARAHGGAGQGPGLGLGLVRSHVWAHVRGQVQAASESSGSRGASLKTSVLPVAAVNVEPAAVHTSPDPGSLPGSEERGLLQPATGSSPEEKGVLLPSQSRPAKQTRAGGGGTQPTEDAAEVMKHVQEAINRMGHEDTDLISRPIHYFWVTGACVALLALLTRSVLHLLTAPGPTDSGAVISMLGSSVLGYVLADLATGFYHFGVDNYGDAATPVFGPQIDAFQGHHRRPWTITKRQFANNLQALARPVLFTAVLLLCLPLGPAQDSFLSVFFACVMFSQQFHAWAHTPKPLLPSAVVALQDAGLLVSRRMHGAHHRPPFNSNYCIVSGLCNKPLDRLGVLSGLERAIFHTFGVAPRSWSNAEPEWLLAQSVPYYEDGTDTVE